MTIGWDDDPYVAAWPGLPQLDGDVTADACVVGLGASGLAAIEALVQRGLRVVGVDSGRVAAGAAGRNGGFLVAGPADSLHEAIDAWGPEPAVALYRETLAEITRLADRFGPELIRRVGSIRLAGLPGEPQSEAEAADREAELADCAAHAKALHEHGIAVQEYDGELGRGLFLPDDAATNPAHRALATAAALRDRAELYERTPVNGVAAGRVVTERGTIRADRIVVAVDGRLDLLLPQLRDRVRSARLQMLATSPGTAARLPCPIYGRWGYDYGQQGPDGRYYVGGGRDRFREQEWTTDARPTSDVQAWIEQVATRLAGEQVGITHRWGAAVGFTADGRPLCTTVDEGVVACGGYNGTGNLVGPLAARAAAALVADGTPPPSYLAG